MISTAVLLAGALIAVIWYGLSTREPHAPTVAATAAVSAEVSAAGFDTVDVDGVTEAEELVRSGAADAAAVDSASSPTGVEIIVRNKAPPALVETFSITPSVRALDEDAQSQTARTVFGVIFGFVFMMAALSFGSPITTSVVEEKQTRIVEVLLAAITARSLLTGKILAATALALAQIVALILTVVLGLWISGRLDLLAAIGPSLAWFGLFFLFGFLLLATMFAVAGALVSRQEDAGATQSPLIYLTMTPYLLVVFFSGNAAVMTALSYIPFSAAVSMPIRIYFGDLVGWWEPPASLVLLGATCLAILWLGARIYENSLLHMGARLSLREAVRRVFRRNERRDGMTATRGDG